MRRIAFLLVVFALAACDEPPQPIAKPAVVSAKPWELTQEESAACLDYAKAAGGLATDRDNGIPLSVQLENIRERFGAAPAEKEFAQMATAIYQNPVFNKQTPEAEEESWAMDCDIRVEKMKAGAKYFNSPAEIASGLADFKTFDGTPLVDLFGKYGITIAYVEAVPAEVYEPIPHEKGEIVYQITFGHGATRTMPCRLREWFNVPMMPMPEIIRRGAEFPHIRPEEDDAAIYWAATGKCSKAY